MSRVEQEHDVVAVVAIVVIVAVVLIAGLLIIGASPELVMDYFEDKTTVTPPN